MGRAVRVHLRHIPRAVGAAHRSFTPQRWSSGTAGAHGAAGKAALRPGGKGDEDTQRKHHFYCSWGKQLDVLAFFSFPPNYHILPHYTPSHLLILLLYTTCIHFTILFPYPLKGGIDLGRRRSERAGAFGGHSRARRSGHCD